MSGDRAGGVPVGICQRHVDFGSLACESVGAGPEPAADVSKKFVCARSSWEPANFNLMLLRSLHLLEYLSPVAEHRLQMVALAAAR